ncbi:MAG: hypothetical protein H6774_02540 [Pseudomonadales bacterium]|nr:hypothetical protein [Candidatus Woesebacteria bacterium]MCB9801942.1 hypothetical protein [Pseudomonadales bacterium]
MQDAAQPQVATSEALEDQNIFHLLGVTDGSDEERESFLDELQQVIWDDFLDFDVKLLITSDEYEEFQTIRSGADATDLENQEKIVVFLEKLIPDLEDIMLEKALELKGDMVRERIAGMREYHSGNTQALAQIDQAEAQLRDDLWKSAADTLNAIG